MLKENIEHIEFTSELKGVLRKGLLYKLYITVYTFLILLSVFVLIAQKFLPLKHFTTLHRTSNIVVLRVPF